MSTPEHEQISILSAADLKSLLNNVDLSQFATEINGQDFSNVLPTLHDVEAIEFSHLLPLVNGNGETSSCGLADADLISDSDLHNLSLSPLKTSDFCNDGYATATTSSAPLTSTKRRRHSFCLATSTTLSSRYHYRHLRRVKSFSSVTSLTDYDCQSLRYEYPYHRRDATPTYRVETVDVLGYQLPLVSMYGDPQATPCVCVSDVFQTFFNRRHWDEFKEILSKNNVESAFGTTRNSFGHAEEVAAITVDQCRSLLLNNQARKEGFVRCIRLSVDNGASSADAPSNSLVSSCTSSATTAAGGTLETTTLIQAAERQVGELSSGIRTRHADQSDIIYVEFDGRTLPSILVNGRQYVRLVDVQKSILSATPAQTATADGENAVSNKHVGYLKALCSDAAIDVGKCRPNEKARLVVYANSYRSNSLHVIAAEDLPRLVSLYRNPHLRQQQPTTTLGVAAKRKYTKRSRDLDYRDDDVVGDREFDEALSIMYEKHYNRRSSRDEAKKKKSYKKKRSIFVVDNDDESRPSSTTSSSTVSCYSDYDNKVTTKPVVTSRRPPRPSSAGDAVIVKDYANFVVPSTPLVTTSIASRHEAINSGSNFAAHSSRKLYASSFEEMLASADDFYKNRLPKSVAMTSSSSSSTKPIDKNGQFPLLGDEPNIFDKLSTLGRKNRANFVHHHQQQQTDCSVDKKFLINGGDNNNVGKYNNYLHNSPKNLFDQFQAHSYSSTAGFNEKNPPPCWSKKNGNKFKSLNFTSTYSHNKTFSKMPVGRQSSSCRAEVVTPPPFITPEVAMLVDTETDLDLGRDESLVTSVPVQTYSRPCAVYLNRSAQLPVAVYNRRFQRGAAGFYHDHLFVDKSSQCILCLKCRKFTTLRYFVTHTHDVVDNSSSTLADPMLFMFVRNAGTDRFDLWRNLCAKARRFSLEKYVNYSLPDNLAEYYEESRSYSNVTDNNSVAVNVISNHGNNVINDDQQSQKAAAQILLSLARGK